MKLCLLFTLSMALWAQPVSVGVIGGVPVTDVVKSVNDREGFNLSNERNYIVGPTVQINLPARFGVEVDGLYRSLGFSYDTASFTGVSTEGHSWEVPIMAKFEILPGPIRPFIQGGANFRYISGVSRTAQSGGISVPFDADGFFQPGFTFGGGVAFKFGRVRISPQLRYTHWGEENLRDPLNSFLRVASNQGDFLVALTF